MSPWTRPLGFYRTTHLHPGASAHRNLPIPLMGCWECSLRVPITVNKGFHFPPFSPASLRPHGLSCTIGTLPSWTAHCLITAFTVWLLRGMFRYCAQSRLHIYNHTIKRLLPRHSSVEESTVNHRGCRVTHLAQASLRFPALLTGCLGTLFV